MGRKLRVPLCPRNPRFALFKISGCHRLRRAWPQAKTPNGRRQNAQDRGRGLAPAISPKTGRYVPRSLAALLNWDLLLFLLALAGQEAHSRCCVSNLCPATCPCMVALQNKQTKKTKQPTNKPTNKPTSQQRPIQNTKCPRRPHEMAKHFTAHTLTQCCHGAEAQRASLPAQPSLCTVQNQWLSPIASCVAASVQFQHRTISILITNKLI